MAFLNAEMPFGASSIDNSPQTVDNGSFKDLTSSLLQDLQFRASGGEASASEAVFHELMCIRRSGKPVVVSLCDQATSAAYQVAGDCLLMSPNMPMTSMRQLQHMASISSLLLVNSQGGQRREVQLQWRHNNNTHNK